MLETLPPKDGDPTPPNEENQTHTREATESKSQHITGLKLGLVVASVTFVAFLMLLDMSIIVTVSWYLDPSQWSAAQTIDSNHRRSHISRASSILLTT